MGGDDSYYGVYLKYKGKNRTHYLHRIVAEAFIPNPNNLPCVDHINGNKHDNRAENLRWISYSDNTKNYMDKRGHKHYAREGYRPVAAYDMDNNLVGYYDNVAKASFICTGNHNRMKYSIYLVIDHVEGHLQAYGYKWVELSKTEYYMLTKENPDLENKVLELKRTRIVSKANFSNVGRKKVSVIKTDENGIETVYESLRSAAADINGNYQSIRYAAENNTKYRNFS